MRQEPLQGTWRWAPRCMSTRDMMMWPSVLSDLLMLEASRSRSPAAPDAFCCSKPAQQDTFWFCYQLVPQIFRPPVVKPKFTRQAPMSALPGTLYRCQPAQTDQFCHKESHVIVRPDCGKATLPKDWLYWRGCS